MGGYENKPRCGQLSTLLPLSHLILVVSTEGVRILRMPKAPRAPYSIITGTADASSSVGSGMLPGRVLRQI
jgi:hypothetical protein